MFNLMDPESQFVGVYNNVYNNTNKVFWANSIKYLDVDRISRQFDTEFTDID